MTLRQRLTVTLVLVAVPLIAGVAWVRQELARNAGQGFYRSFFADRMADTGRSICEANPSQFGPRADEVFGHRFRGRTRSRDGAAAGPSSSPQDEAGEGPVPPGGAATPVTSAGRGRGAGGDGRRRDSGFGMPYREVWAYDASFVSLNPQAPPFPAALRKDLDRGDAITVTSSPAANGRWSSYESALRMDWDSGPCAVLLVRGDGPKFSRFDKKMLYSAASVSAGFLVLLFIAAGPIVRRIHALTDDVRRSAAAHYQVEVGVRGSDEIAALARAFNEAAANVRAHLAQVEKRESTLRTFLANTTHDVMLPLTVLQGHLAELGRARDGTAASSTLIAAQEEAHYIASLLHNLGAVARLDAGDPLLATHPVDLGALVERVVERHRPIARARAIEIGHAVPEAPVLALGDVTLFEQAVSNVVHNAVRYNRSGGHVAVLLETTGERFVLRVIDDGPGVSDDQMSRLTDRRYRGDEARSREPYGSGLGLHIARSVAERFGLAMTLARSEAGGLEVRFEGPRVDLDRG